MKNEGLLKQIALVPANKGNGGAFYKFLFVKYPQHQHFFKGHENDDPNTMPASPYWGTQGVILLRKLHRLVEYALNEDKFNASVEVMIISHYRRGIEAPVWHGLGDILGGFVSSLGVEPVAEWGPFCAAIAKVADECATRGYALQ